MGVLRGAHFDFSAEEILRGEQRYYDGMLYLMSMMHCSGEFWIWGPKSL
jgi:endo-1,4-beta-D-glucanase Y